MDSMRVKYRSPCLTPLQSTAIESKVPISLSYSFIMHSMRVKVFTSGQTVYNINQIKEILGNDICTQIKEILENDICTQIKEILGNDICTQIKEIFGNDICI